MGHFAQAADKRGEKKEGYRIMLTHPLARINSHRSSARGRLCSAFWIDVFGRPFSHLLFIYFISRSLLTEIDLAAF